MVLPLGEVPLGSTHGAMPALAPFMVLSAPEDRVARALERRVEGRSPLAGTARAAVVFDVGHAAWTVDIHGPYMTLHPGRIRRPDAVVQADAVTLAAVVEGTASGAEAFLGGRLTIRGNMALAMKLEGVDDPARPARFVRARTVQALGLDTFFLEAGQGPPVVLLHGLGATNASMLPTLADLAHDHRVLAPDLPGFGDTDKPFRAYHADFFARWLAAFLDAVGVRRADLVGNSMGGRIAIETALQTPERVGHLVLFAPSLAFKRFRTLAPLVRFLAAELAVLPLVAPRGLVTGTLRRMFAQPERLAEPWYQAAVDEFLRVFATPRGRVAFFSAARQIYLEEPNGPDGFWHRLPALSHPALFLWGDRDQLVPWQFSRHVEAVLPHALSVVLRDCGHVPQFEHPARTHRLVREFLGRPRL